MTIYSEFLYTFSFRDFSCMTAATVLHCVAYALGFPDIISLSFTLQGSECI